MNGGFADTMWSICLAWSMMVAVCCLPKSFADNPEENRDRIELSFQLPQVKGNPFDYTVNDVRVTLSTPSGTDVSLPAFYDGGTTWKARHLPDSPGRYTLRSISLNGDDAKPVAISQSDFNFSAVDHRGFVRIDPKDKMRFAFDDGSSFYPVGYNLAWQSHGQVEMPPLVESLDRMGRAGVNWTRIWMNAWDGKNLDWPIDSNDRIEPGTLLLPVAEVWDAIVERARENHIYFQMVLQHHGQYNTTNDSNWSINPWNKANGGWLDTPEQFFTDERAIQLTKNKFRYIIARWGYSPSIMAFELCNEVESTDGFRKNLKSVAEWHRTMAQFIRSQDRYKHLITTSSNTTEKSIWPATDYYQAHAYPADLISAITGLDDQKLDRAYFYGEMGASSSGNALPPPETLHRILWASLMSGSAGTGEYWDWFEVEPRNLLGQFTAVQNFIKLSGMLSDRELHTARLQVQTVDRGPLVFGPGRDWAPSTATSFAVKADGSVENLGGMSAFLQGRGANHAMFPFASFEVNYPDAGTFAIEADQTTPSGARLEASLDEKPMAAVIIKGTARTGRRPGGTSSDQNNRINITLELPIPAGPHVIRLENTGSDWIHIQQFVLTPYASQLAVLAKTSHNRAILWAYRRSTDANAKAVVGTIKIPNLAIGGYLVTWWDTAAGTVIKTSSVTVNGGALTLTTPPVDHDLACAITPATNP